MKLLPILLFSLLLSTPPDADEITADTERPETKLTAEKKSSPEKKSPPEKSKKQTELVPKTEKIWLKKLKYRPEKNVQTAKIGETEVWCESNPQWKAAHLTAAIAAGSAYDPDGLSGISRFLANIVRERLNRPKNPARNIFPPGNSRYHLIMDKIWVKISATVQPGDIQTAIPHLSKSISRPVEEKELNSLRNFLAKTSGKFPPLSLKENVELLLFGPHSRGLPLRGSAKTFRNAQLFLLKESQEKLYAPHRIRWLVLAPQCEPAIKALEKEFKNKKSKTPLPKGAAAIFPKKEIIRSSISSKNPMQREFMSLYLLPTLHRHDYPTLFLTFSIIKKELEYNLQKLYGEYFTIFTFLQPEYQNGYAAIITFSQPLMREKLEEEVKKIIGRLQLKGYSPALEQRLTLFLTELKNEYSSQLNSQQFRSQWLLQQLLLPPNPKPKKEEKGLEIKIPPQPLDMTAIIDSTTPALFRELALHYFERDIKFQMGVPPFSLQRIVFFIGILILMWLLIDLFFRRSRS